MKTQEEIFAINKAKEDSGIYHLSTKGEQLFECYSVFGEIKWEEYGYYTPGRFCKPTFGPLPEGHTGVSCTLGKYL